MATYLMNELRIRDGIASEDGLAHVKRTVEAYGGRWHADRADRPLEAARQTSLVLVEFGNMSQAQNWYNSTEYGNVSRLYVENAIDLMLVDGVSPDFTMAGLAQERSVSPTRCAWCRTWASNASVRDSRI